MNINNKLLAKSISYDTSIWREYESVKYIVIHYTSNSGDTAWGNAHYFAEVNTKEVGAHFFVDKKGEVYKSVPIHRIAWAVGRDYRDGTPGEATYYGKCTNANSVSIELCDCNVATNNLQTKAVKQLIKEIRKKCPNAKTIIRHWDVNGKDCPLPFVGKNNRKWKDFLYAIS